MASGDIDLQRQRHLPSQLATSSTNNYGVKTTISRVLKGKNGGLPVEPYPVEMGYKSARGSSGSKKSGSGKRKGEKSRKQSKGSDDISEDGYHKKKGGDKGTPKGDDSYDDEDGDKPKKPKKDKGDKVSKGDKGGPKDDDDSNIRPGDEDKIIEEEISLNLRMAVRNGGNIERHYDDLIDMTSRIADLALEGVVKKLRKKNRMLFLEVDVLDIEVEDSISQGMLLFLVYYLTIWVVVGPCILLTLVIPVLPKFPFMYRRLS